MLIGTHYLHTRTHCTLNTKHILNWLTLLGSRHLSLKVVENETAVNMIFFDGGLGWLAENPHPTPSGLIGGSNCSVAFRENATSPGGKDLNFTDADRLEAVQAQLQLLVEAGTALNQRNIVGTYSTLSYTLSILSAVLFRLEVYAILRPPLC